MGLSRVAFFRRPYILYVHNVFMVYPWHQQQLGTLIETLQNYHKNIFTTNFSTRYHPSIINTIHHFSAGRSHYEVNKVHSHSPYTYIV